MKAMDRRRFLQVAGMAFPMLSLAARKGVAFADAGASAWRVFDVTTHVEILNPSGVTRIWVPVSLIENAPFQRTVSVTWQCPEGAAKTFKDHDQALGVVRAEFPAGKKAAFTVTNRVATRDWSADVSSRAPSGEAMDARVKKYLRPTAHIPTDGIVKQKAVEITRGAGTDLEKARAIYEWVVLNTYRNPKTRGCGRGDIRFMLESGDLGGKCADLNALYVGLARAAGLPARDAYGIRIAPSQKGYKSLGTATESATKAQHCRAEVYLRGHGWVPVDPADVRKVILEEPPGNLALQNEKVEEARRRLFGSWEMNWMAYNYAQDVTLPGSTRAAIPFFMYPHAETAEGEVDSLDAATFRYDIVSRPVVAGV